MAIPRVGNNLPNGSFNPVIYSKKLLAKFYSGSVCDKVCNRNWEGEITGAGSSVQIRQRPDVSVTPSAIDGKVQWSDLVDASQSLSIDYSFDAAVKIANIDARNFDINLHPEIVDEISQRLRLVVESTILGSAYLSAGSDIDHAAYTSWNTDGSAIKTLAKAQSLLARANAPVSGRFFVMSPEMAQALLISTALQADASGLSEGAIQRGFVKNLFGFDIYQSNLIPGTGTAADPYQCIAGHTEAITLATKFTQFDMFPQLEQYYGAGVRAQNAFGFLVTNPSLLVHVEGYIS